MTIDKAIELLEKLERRAITTRSRKSLISLDDINRLRKLLSTLRT